MLFANCIVQLGYFLKKKFSVLRLSKVSCSKLLIVVCIATFTAACAPNSTSGVSEEPQIALNAPGIERLAKVIDVNTIMPRLSLMTDGVSSDISVSPVNTGEGRWTSTFLVSKGMPFSVTVVWSAVGVDGIRVDYGKLEREYIGVSTNIVIDTSQEAYDTSSATFDDDGDSVSNFEELVAGTPPSPVGGGNGPDAVSPVLVIAGIKTFEFSWADVSGATHYRVLENPDGISGLSQVGSDIPPGTEAFEWVVPLYARTNAQYIVQSCINQNCTNSPSIFVGGNLASAVGYFKASNTDAGDVFGRAVSLSENGNTLAVAARNESSSASGVNGNQSDNSSEASGAVYVFSNNNGEWAQQAYIKSSNPDPLDFFGHSMSLSSDGKTLAVGAWQEASNATGIDGNQFDNSVTQSGAVYIFTLKAGGWEQEAYLKASNADAVDVFGAIVSISGDGNTLIVGAGNEDGGVAGVNSDQSDNSADSAGAAYVFSRSGNVWTQQAYLKASNPDVNDLFGSHVTISSDGNTVAVAARHEGSAASGINGDQLDNSLEDAGAVYIFTRIDDNWVQQAYLKASNTDALDNFGITLDLNANGNTLVASAFGESSSATGINGDQSDNSASESGAVYVFVRSGGTWTQQAYLKASNSESMDHFGRGLPLSLSSDGNFLAVGTGDEDSGSIGINGDQLDNSAESAGAVYFFKRTAGIWSQQAYVKSSNTESQDIFGNAVSLSGDGNTLAVRATGEDSSATGINGDQSDNSSGSSGAVYLY